MEKISEFARYKAAQLWCKSKTEKLTMIPELAEEIASLIDEYRSALIWCSASADFQEGGQARKGWQKIKERMIG